MHKHTISLRHALSGIWVAVATQTNLRIHFLVASLALALAVLYHVSVLELLVLLLTIALVMVAELVNTALEFLSDAVTLEVNESIKRAKDVGAGAVLLTAIFAVIIGMLIFAPKLL